MKKLLNKMPLAPRYLKSRLLSLLSLWLFTYMVLSYHLLQLFPLSPTTRQLLGMLGSMLALVPLFLILQGCTYGLTLWRFALGISLVLLCLLTLYHASMLLIAGLGSGLIAEYCLFSQSYHTLVDFFYQRKQYLQSRQAITK